MQGARPSAARQVALQCNALQRYPFKFLFFSFRDCVYMRRVLCAPSKKRQRRQKGSKKGDENRWRCVAADEALLAAQETRDPSFLALGAKKKEVMTGTRATLKLTISSFLANKQQDRDAVCLTCSSNPVPSLIQHLFNGPSATDRFTGQIRPFLLVSFFSFLLF